MSDYQLEVAKLPTRTQRIALRILHKLGWTLNYKPLPGPRGILVVYPHTSNWDFPIGVLAKLAIGEPFHFIAKSSLFTGLTGFLIGWLMRRLGGEPIERGVATGAIARLAEKIRQADWYWMAIAPEGTRSLKPYWRSGFYHIACGAQIPLGCAYFDFKKKLVSLVDYIELSGDQEQDMANLRQIFAGVQGFDCSKASPIILKQD